MLTKAFFPGVILMPETPAANGYSKVEMLQHEQQSNAAVRHQAGDLKGDENIPRNNDPNGGKLILKSDMRNLEIVTAVVNNKIAKITLSEDGSTGEAIGKDGTKIKLRDVPISLDLFKIFGEHQVDVTISQSSFDSGRWLREFVSKAFVPVLILSTFFYLVSRTATEKSSQYPQGGGGVPPSNLFQDSAAQFTKSKSRMDLQPNTGVTFSDVAGCEEAKTELLEIVEFLQNPEKFTKLGAKIPKGVMMEGPPGTGKTLLAKAVAGEAGVPFVSASGSSFVELYVGVGASRVRDMFKTAINNSPCIVFIDEIDAIGRQRGTGIAGGNDEREQTLNEILTQMDGFEGNEDVIVLAATNRADVLDPALLRPGRFDRRVQINLPDLRGRSAILQVHARRKPLAADVDLSAVARRTPGFSGASLQALMNEAAIYAARDNKMKIENGHVDAAIDRILVGIAKRGGGDTLLRRKDLVAYHEAGHAIVGALINGYDAVQKVTIIPRTSGAGGLTFFDPDETRMETGMYSRGYLEGQIVVALGGRVAEELVFGDDEVTTGASNDIQQVTNVARRMVSEWGFSSIVGNVAIDHQNDNPFLGRKIAIGGGSWSNKKLEEVDDEVDRIIKNAYDTCKKILMENRELLDGLAERLMEQETVSGAELYQLIDISGAESYVFEPVSHKGGGEGEGGGGGQAPRLQKAVA